MKHGVASGALGHHSKQTMVGAFVDMDLNLLGVLLSIMESKLHKNAR